MTSEELELLLLTVPRDQLLEGVHHPVPPYITKIAHLAIHTPEELRKWLPLIYEAEDNEELFTRRMGVLLRVRNPDLSAHYSLDTPKMWHRVLYGSCARDAHMCYRQHNFVEAAHYTYWVLLGAPVDHRTAAFPAFLAAAPSLLPTPPAPAAKTAASPLPGL